MYFQAKKTKKHKTKNKTTTTIKKKQSCLCINCQNPYLLLPPLNHHGISKKAETTWVTNRLCISVRIGKNISGAWRLQIVHKRLKRGLHVLIILNLSKLYGNVSSILVILFLNIELMFATILLGFFWWKNPTMASTLSLIFYRILLCDLKMKCNQLIFWG